MIITGGNIEQEFLYTILQQQKFDYTIVVDGGLSAIDELLSDNSLFWDSLYAKFNHTMSDDTSDLNKNHTDMQSRQNIINNPDKESRYIQRQNKSDNISDLNKDYIIINEIVGDFDTIDLKILKKYQYNSQIQITKHSPEKDATDTELAIIRAIELDNQKRESEITIIGGIGTRLDHTIGNISCLKIPLDNGIKCKIIDSHNEISLINKNTKFIKKGTFGKYISFLPFTDIVKGIDLIGFKYPLKSVDITRGNTLCISNELKEEVCELHLKEGCLICIKSQD